MKGRWRKLGGLLIAAVITLCAFSPSVYAEAEVTEFEVPVHHSFVETEAEVSDMAWVLQRGAYLSSGTVKLVNNGDGTVSIYGGTTGTQICDKIYLNIYLERSSDGKNFYSYKSWEYTASNAAKLNKSFDYSVPTGYWYRLRGYHAAEEGNVKESTSTMTNGKYI